MKAQFVYENMNFERGNEPKDSMDIGMKQKVYNNLLELNRVPGVLGMQFKWGKDGGPRLFVKYVGDIWKGNKNYWEELVNKHIGEYAEYNLGDPDDEYFSFQIYPEYSNIIKDILDES